MTREQRLAESEWIKRGMPPWLFDVYQHVMAKKILLPPTRVDFVDWRMNTLSYCGQRAWH